MIFLFGIFEQDFTKTKKEEKDGQRIFGETGRWYLCQV